MLLEDMSEAKKFQSYFYYNRKQPLFCMRTFRNKIESHSTVEDWGPDGDQMYRFADGSKLLYRKIVNEFQL